MEKIDNMASLINTDIKLGVGDKLVTWFDNDLMKQIAYIYQLHKS